MGKNNNNGEIQGAGLFVAAANPAGMSHTKKVSAPCISPTLTLTLVLTFWPR